MNKYIMYVDSVVNTFSLIEAGIGYKLKYSFSAEKKTEFSALKEGDTVFIYYGAPRKSINIVLSVAGVSEGGFVEFVKVLESEHGYKDISVQLEENLESKILVKVDDVLAEKIVNTLLSNGLNITGITPKGSSNSIKYARNRIIFGAPGTGKSYTLNKEKDTLLSNGGDYERVTFHPDYSYANFVGTYKPVMVSNKRTAAEKDTDYVISILNDEGKTAQEKYDVLFERFKDDGLTRLPILLGLYTDDIFKTRKQDGTDTVGDNSVERNHGRAIRKYVNLITEKDNNSDIAYEYVPGPFMRVYVNALKSARSADPKPYLLIIEEINRANVAAVFGEIFQLLDRNEDGVSEYPIQASEDIKKHLAKELGGNPEDYNEIKIPDNMFIWATMNSADQGVFPMDTAFKRRWDFTYIGIDDNDEDIRGKYVVVGSENKQKIEWNELRKAINEFLAEEKINEDKQLGPYFISRKITVPSGEDIDAVKFAEAFKNKVLMYLFDDAAKQKRPRLFEGMKKGQNRYSEVCEAFDKQGIGIFNGTIQGRMKNTEDLKVSDYEIDKNGFPIKETEQ